MVAPHPVLLRYPVFHEGHCIQRQRAQDGNTAILLRYVSGNSRRKALKPTLSSSAASRSTAASPAAPAPPARTGAAASKTTWATSSSTRWWPPTASCSAPHLRRRRLPRDQGPHRPRLPGRPRQRRPAPPQSWSRRGGRPPRRSHPRFDSLNHFFLISEMIVPGSSYWNIGMGWEKGDVERDDEAIKTMHVLGRTWPGSSRSFTPSSAQLFRRRRDPPRPASFRASL